MRSAARYHLAGVNLEDVDARALVGVRELDLAVDAPGPQQRRIQDVDAVGGHQHLHGVTGETFVREGKTAGGS